MRRFEVIMLTSEGATITCRVDAPTRAAAMARVLGWKRQREDETITTVGARPVDGPPPPEGLHVPRRHRVAGP